MTGALLFGLGGPAQADTAPAAGRYTGQLCVANRASEPQCGPANVVLHNPRQAELRISDMRYSLTLHSSQVDVVLKHGAMQIDGFTGTYEWAGTGHNRTLRFVDADKRVTYEVQFGRRLPRPAK